MSHHYQSFIWSVTRAGMWQLVGDVQEEEENFPLHPLWTLVWTSEQRRLEQTKGEEDEEAGSVLALPGPAKRPHR